MVKDRDGERLSTSHGQALAEGHLETVACPPRDQVQDGSCSLEKTDDFEPESSDLRLPEPESSDLRLSEPVDCSELLARTDSAALHELDCRSSGIAPVAVGSSGHG